MIIDGRKIAADTIAELKKKEKLKRFLAVFLAGDDAPSADFVRQKEKVAQELGVDFRVYKFAEGVTRDFLRKEILKITKHKTCGGAIVQLPLPPQVDKYYVLNVIPREKDVDVLGERALGAFYATRNPVLPPAVGVVQKIMENRRLKIEKLKVAVVGLGFLVGQPVSQWLKGKAAEIYLLDIGSSLSSLKQADLVISGVGKADLIKPAMLKDGATVIDFGYDFKDGKISGDFDSLGIENSKLSIDYTPTPGGTGPILVAQVFENFYKLDKTPRIY